MATKKIPKSLIIGAGVFAASMFLIYSNLIIYSLDFYKPRPAYWDLTNDINPLWNCFKKSGLQLFSIDHNTFPSLTSCRNFNYGYSSMLSFGLFHLITSNATFWGILQILLFSMLLGILILQNKLKNNVASILALASPGIFLLATSGNMDIQVVCLLLLSSMAICHDKPRLALIMVCIASIFKFYSAPILLLLTLLFKGKRERFFGVVIFCFTSFIIFFQMVYTPIPPFPGGAQNKFGAMIIGNYSRKAGVFMSNLTGEILGILMIIILLVAFFFLRTEKSSKKEQFTGTTTKDLLNSKFHTIFLLFGGTSVICYFSALNVDYRLVFISIGGLSLMQINQLKIRFFTKMFPVYLLISLWFVFPGAYLKKYLGFDFQPIGDVALALTIAYFVLQGAHLTSVIYRSKKILV